jgi:hypothetical protein
MCNAAYVNTFDSQRTLICVYKDNTIDARRRRFTHALHPYSASNEQASNMCPPMFGYSKTILSVCVLLMSRLQAAQYPEHLISVQTEGVIIDTFVRSGVRFIKVHGAMDFSRGEVPVPLRVTCRDLLLMVFATIKIRECQFALPQF